MTDGWFLVDTVGDTPAVLMIGARSKQWRPLSNEFRGSVHKTVLRLLETVLNNLKQSQVLIDLAGPRLALATPALGPTRQVHGVLMWIGDPLQTPPTEPAVRAWEFDLVDRVSPYAIQDPRRTGTPSTTLTDWLSGFARPTDVLRVAREMRDASVGFRGVGEWIDLTGAVHRYAYRCTATFDGPRLLGVSVPLPETLQSDDADLVARRLSDETAAAGRLAPALLDAESGRVVAWLSTSRPELPADVLNGSRAAPAPVISRPWSDAPEWRLGFFAGITAQS